MPISNELIDQLLKDCHSPEELLGLWIAKNEGTKFWLSVMTELKNPGVTGYFYCLL